MTMTNSRESRVEQEGKVIIYYMTAMNRVYKGIIM